MTAPARPLVGLTSYRETAAWGVWDTRADVLAAAYAQAVEAAGGVPVLLPPSGPEAEAAAVVVGRLDALVVCGGADLAPRRYGATPHPRTGAAREDRDRWELALVAAADRAGLPLLGICRGLQVMAVGAGGTLDQHLPDLLGTDHHDPGGDAFGVVAVAVRPGSRLHGLVGDRLEVRCHHHQAVREHPGYTVAAESTDGVIEAFERPGDRFSVAVQWHPEMARDAGLFAGLVQAARGR